MTRSYWKQFVSAFVLLVVFGVSSSAKADLTVTYLGNLGNSPTPLGGGVFAYHAFYQATLDLNTKLTAGQYFTIYDYNGLIGETPGANWSAVVSGVGLNPPTITPIVDNPLIPNVSFVYTGPTVTGSTNWVVGLDSTYPGTTDGEYSSVSTSTVGAKREINTHGFTIVPNPVPLPSASWMGLTIMSVMGVFYGYRRRPA